VKGNRGEVATICVHSQHRLLRHDSGWQKEGRFFAKEGRDLAFKFLHDPAKAVHVYNGVIRNLSQQRRDGARSVTGEESCALLR
jgi:hypothetical protein